MKTTELHTRKRYSCLQLLCFKAIIQFTITSGLVNSFIEDFLNGDPIIGYVNFSIARCNKRLYLLRRQKRFVR